MTAIRILNLLLRRIRLLIGVPIALAVLAVAWTLATAEFSADASFRPQVSDADASRLAGLAAQFGFTMPTGGSGESLQFFADVLRSRSVLTALITTQYAVPRMDEDTLRGNLIELFGIDEDTPHKEMLAALNEMDERLEVQTDVESGIIRFQVLTPWPALSEALGRRLLSLLNEYNLERRQSQAAQERRFVESRRSEAQSSLAEAEDELRDFLADNRTYQESPRLVFEHARLQRQVELQQTLYTTLAQAYEQARIEEVRNTPVVTVIDPPEGSARLAANPIGAALLAGILGFMAALAFVFGRIWFREQRTAEPAAVSELRLALGSLIPHRFRSRSKPPGPVSDPPAV